jgi:DNA-binding CsgD family transcriptional regulator
MNHLAIIFFILGLAVGMLTIYTTYFENRKYKTDLVRYIFYFIIVTNLATVTNLFYNYFLINLINNLNFIIAKLIELFYRFSANILLLFVFGVMISLFRHLSKESFSKKYKGILLSIWLIFMILFLIKSDSLFVSDKNIPIPILINVLINLAGILIVIFEIIRTIVKTSKNPDPVKKKIILKFSGSCLLLFLIILLTITLLILQKISNDLQLLISSLIFLFVFNLLPLLYLKKVLKNYYHDINIQRIPSEITDKLLRSKRISQTELKIINLICDGYTNKEIADKLFLSLQTIKDHNYRIFKKLDVSNRVQLAKTIRG